MAIHHRRSERVATILLCAAALLRLGDGDSSALTWCTGGRRDPGAGYSKFAYTLDMAINATLVASDRSAVAATKEEVKAGLKPDFALSQCRPDVTTNQCFRCLGGHRDGLVGAGGEVCATGGARDGICLLRYDVEEFSSIFDQDERMGSVYGAAVGARPGLTKDVVYGLLDKVVANDTLANGSRAVAGRADYPDGGTVYGLAQCLTQLSAPDCNRCLRDALLRLSEQFNSSAGMQVLRPSCMLQYNNSIFFNTSLLPVIHVDFPGAPASSPAPSSSQAAPSSKHGRSFRIGIVAAVAAAAFVLTATLLLALCFFARRQRNRKSTGAGNYRYQDLVAATRNFSNENMLGSGGCGVVYKGTLEIGQEIAVKKLTNKGLRESEREVSLVAELQHENLVKFLGYCFHEGGMFLIYEYPTNKDLGYYFKGNHTI